MITMNTKKTYMILHEEKESLEWMNSEERSASEGLIYVRHCSRCFQYPGLFNPHNGPVRSGC